MLGKDNIFSTLIATMWIVIGLMTTSLGISLSYACALGSAPMATFSDGLHALLNISYGAANTLANIALLAILFRIRRDFIGIGTFLCVFAIGPAINLFSSLLAGFGLDCAPLITRLAGVAVGTLLAGTGLGLYMAAGLGFGALEGIVQHLCEKKGLHFARVKIAQDSLLVLTGILAGAQWGLGTLAAMLLTGPVMQASVGIFSRLLTRKRKSVAGAVGTASVPTAGAGNP